MINAGSLDRSVTLLEPTEATNDIGEVVASAWSEVATVRASKNSLRVADAARAQMHGQIAEATFVIRWRSDVTNKLRLRFEGTDFEIIAVEEIGRKRGLKLLVKVG